jgi:hypothetical protein
MFFYNILTYSDSDNDRTNERYNGSEPEFGCAYARD